MRSLKQRFIRLIIGLFLFSLGILLTIQANIGYAPWDVFHVGFAETIGISLGTASIVVGLAIGVITILLGEKLGVGTLLNMFLIGIFIDVLILLEVIPTVDNYFLGILMLIIGLFTIALGSYFYIGSGFGAGPRDSLMVGLIRKTKLPVGLCRVMIELSAALVGYKLGGLIGFGTIIAAVAIGFCVQVTFKLLDFDTTTVKHETLQETFNTIKASSNI